MTFPLMSLSIFSQTYLASSQLTFLSAMSPEERLTRSVRSALKGSLSCMTLMSVAISSVSSLSWPLTVPYVYGSDLGLNQQIQIWLH